LRVLRRGLVLVLALTLSAASGDVLAAGQAPRISKPKPVPPGLPSTVPQPPAAHFDNGLLIGGDDVKAREVETRMSVEVRVNGNGPYRFLVDSGADTSAVGLRIARDLQLPLGTPAILNGMTERSLVDRVKVASLTFGPSTITDLEVPALKEQDLGGDGMIGIDALVRQRLMMDFEQHVVKVEDSRIRPVHLPGEIVITARREHGQLILTEVRAAGLPLDAVVDTGSEVTIGNMSLRNKLLRRNHRFTMVPMLGVTGKVMQIEMAQIAELQLGPVTLHDVPIAFADVPPFKMFGLDKDPSLLLGTDILETFRRVSLDFRARKVRFQLRRCTPQTITLNTGPAASFTRISSNGDPTVCMR
jgi:hypothetical protein